MPLFLPRDFDAEAYLALNPDLAAAGVDPRRHFLRHGRREQRKYRRADLDSYVPDTKAVYDQDGLRSVHNHDFMHDPAFQDAYARGVTATGLDYRWHWRVHVGLWAAQQAIMLSGDFVECGVAKGFLSSAIMRSLNWNATGRTFFLLDTFNGIDERYVTEAEREIARRRNERQKRSGLYPTSPDRVIANFAEWKSVEIIVGPVPETLDRVTAERIAFLHIDMNSSVPEIAAIRHFWDRVTPGAPILLDDYAYQGSQAQKRAMDALATEKGVAILSLPTGQGLILKPPA